MSEAANTCIWEGRGSVPERGEGVIRLEALRNALCALDTNVVSLETAGESQMVVSAAANTFAFGRVAAYLREARV